ncbi:MAG: TIGR03621 family F420-dependent LLM class oxidoreductase [Ilumatobacteraceae bacterium]|nr:TIGR03621 family F420-dependent LLM class oxidoreductase [Ilumatobacteraceae bacterium]
MAPFPHRPFRFGVQASNANSRAEWIDLAHKTQDNGFDVLTMPDHFSDQLAPIPALMTIADATSTLRIGALVWDNDYKHPVVLAKELATMDLLSDGRLELGIGAGWMISDYQQAGMPYDSPGVRIDRFIEGMQVIRGAMAPGAFSFSGKHYTITDYDGLPKPIQTPCPPVLIGGGGKRVLTYAARTADIIGINGTMTAGVVGPDAIASMTAEAVNDKVNIVLDAVGDRINDIEMNIRAFFVSVTDDRGTAMQNISKMIRVEPEMIAQTPFALVGSPAQIVQDLLERRDRWGFSYVIVGAQDMESFAPVVAQLRGK